MSDVLSRANILEALYMDAPVIKMYVDLIMQGKPAPYTLLMRSDESIRNEEIVQRLRDKIDYLESIEPMMRDTETDVAIEELKEIMDEAMILEGEQYEIVMFKCNTVVDGSRQIVDAEKVEGLKDYARIKRYEISVKKVEEND